MKVAGVVVEYNPLHNGHVYHLNRTKEVTGCNYIVAVMSGNFVQRGEPALLNKWIRTRMALMAGIDLVLELPVIYSTSSAEGFAFGAVSTLESIGIVDNICFGSEHGNISLLNEIAYILTDEPSEYKSMLQSCLKNGLSFPSARLEALKNFIKLEKLSKFKNADIDNIMSSSNNILGIEYLKALYMLSSKIIPTTIERICSRYNDENISGSISSATSIRKNINNPDMLKSIPSFTQEMLESETAKGRCPITLKNYSDLILYKLRSLDTHQIAEFLDVSEGLENKIKRAAEDSNDIIELMNSVNSKRYTSTRIQRILINCLLGITKDLKPRVKSPVEYIRVLGFNNKGRELINNIKDICEIPVITNPSRNDLDLLRNDVNATDTYVLGYANSAFKAAKQDLKTPPVFINR